jgi:hypothetical protein
LPSICLQKTAGFYVVYDGTLQTINRCIRYSLKANAFNFFVIMRSGDDNKFFTTRAMIFFTDSYIANPDGKCWFYKFRLGRGRPSVKIIRKHCRECMGGSPQLVEACATIGCTLYQFRFGTNPNRVQRQEIDLCLARDINGLLL